MTTKRMGEEGFRWFLGTVENVDDPLQLGRVKIRVMNEHDDPTITTDDLLWATPIVPVIYASNQQVGRSPTGITVGSIAFGFYLDGQEKQIPMIFGTYSKIPDGTQATNDVPALARGQNTIHPSLIGPEPESSYAAQYPFNHVWQTQSGHIIEVDDTPANERIRTYHKSGTYTEISKDGTEVSKIVGDGYEIVAGDKTIYVKGICNIEVVGDCNLIGANNITLTAAAGIEMSAPAGINITKGNLTVADNISSGTGASGAFSTPSGQTVHVQDCIITNIY